MHLTDTLGSLACVYQLPKDVEEAQAGQVLADIMSALYPLEDTTCTLDTLDTSPKKSVASGCGATAPVGVHAASNATCGIGAAPRQTVVESGFRIGNAVTNDDARRADCADPPHNTGISLQSAPAVQFFVRDHDPASRGVDDRWIAHKAPIGSKETVTTNVLVPYNVRTEDSPAVTLAS